MADPYAPFGFARPRFATLSGRENPSIPLADMPMMPPPPTFTPHLMPQSPGEAEDVQAQNQSLVSMGQMGIPFAMGGPLGMAGRLASRVATAAPRATAAAAGGAALTTPAATQGTKASKNAPATPPSTIDPALQRLLEADPVLRSMQAQITEQERIANDRNSYKSIRDGARARATELTTQFNARVSEMSRANLPFDQAYPMLAQNRGLAGLLAPAAVGYATRAAGNMISRVGSGRWERALSRADRALERGDERAYEHFMSRAAQFQPRAPGTASRISHATAPAVGGGLVGAELSMLPYQHNVTNAPMGSAQQREAAEMLADPMKWGPRAAFGFGLGALGGLTGGHLPNIGPGFRPPAGAPTPPPAPLPTSAAAAAPPALPATAPAPALPTPPPPTPPAPIAPTGGAAAWPAPPRVPNPPPPGLSSIRDPRSFGPSPTDSPPQPQSTVGAPARPMPEGAYQDASGRWRRGGRWIRDPSK